MLELTQEEQEYVLATLNSAHTQLLRDLHHTDNREFRRTLRQIVELNECVAAKVGGSMPVTRAVRDWNHRVADL